MGKKAPKKEVARKEDDLEELLHERMPIAQAVLHDDTDAMTSILQDCLPIKGDFTIDEVEIQTSVGESFTGGRSTPVYFVEARVSRPNLAPKRRRFVVKLVCMPGDNDDPYILRRRESYAVERRFYADAAERVRDASLCIPKLLKSDLDGSKPWPAFCILMNDISQQYPIHPDFLSKSQATCALQWLARFHALFWGESSSATWRRDLWDRGAFWTTKTVGTEGISTAWTGTMRYLEQKHPEYVTANTKGLGRRIEAAGVYIANLLAKESAGSQYGTLIHGDYKAANLFFSESPDINGADSVAAVDFQFSGAGLGVEDVAYLLYPDARGDHFDYEEELLETYHEELILQLIAHQKGGPSTLPFEVFQRFYELARIDMTRYWLSKNRWAASTAGEAKLVSVLESTMDRIDGGDFLNGEEEYEAALSKFVGT